jgi:hypothetical protein
MLFPHYPSIAILAISILCCAFASAGTGTGVAGDIAQEAASVISEYRTDDPSARVRVWQSQITHPSGNPKFKEFQAQRLREWETTEFAPYRLNDPALVAQLREVLMPVLSLYGRQDCFQIILINHKVPVMMNDSGVLLMVSTGLIERANSDDELLGHVAHEVGHDLFWRRTAQARGILEIYRTRSSTSLLMQQATQELAKIELECDAFSTITLASMGRSPLTFGRYLEMIERNFPDYIDPNLPLVVLRTKVIESVVPTNRYRVAPQATEAFRKLKALLATEVHHPREPHRCGLKASKGDEKFILFTPEKCSKWQASPASEPANIVTEDASGIHVRNRFFSEEKYRTLPALRRWLASHPMQ